MKEFRDFLQKMGGLHDSIVTYLSWLPSERRLEFNFEDMYSNFEGLPEYTGRQPGVIALHGVSELSISLDTNGPLQIYEFLPDDSDPNVLLVTFSPSGRIRARYNDAVYRIGT